MLKICILMIFILYNILRVKKLKSLNYWKNKNKSILKNIRNELKICYDLIDTPNKILVGGTLLGSIRENDIIVFDDDADLGIFYKTEYEKNEIIKSIENNIKNINYSFVDKTFCHKFINNDTGTFVDIFFYKLENDKYILDKFSSRSLWPNEYFFKK